MIFRYKFAVLETPDKGAKRSFFAERNIEISTVQQRGKPEMRGDSVK